MKRAYHNWHSRSLNRNMELLIFGHTGDVVLFFPTRTARFYDYENWGMIDSLKEKIERGDLQVYCLDSIDQESLYDEHASSEQKINRHLEYESYILTEVLPMIYLENPSGKIISAGCSMGAFHALNIAFKHPQLFNKVLAMSGRYDLTQRIGSFRDLLENNDNQNVYYNSPNKYLANLEDSQILNELRKLKIIITIGSQDVFLENNYELNHTLWNKEIPHEFYVWSGEAHKPKYWKQMLALYL